MGPTPRAFDGPGAGPVSPGPLGGGGAGHGGLCPGQPEADGAAFLGRKDFPVQQLLSPDLGDGVLGWYVPQAIRTSLTALLALNPKDEYPRPGHGPALCPPPGGAPTRGKPTPASSGSSRRPRGCTWRPCGCWPWRPRRCSWTQGWTAASPPARRRTAGGGDTHVAATAEKLNLKQPYEVAVIDECQMIADRQRGYAWTRAILGVQAPEVHLCAAPEAKDLLVRLIESRGDSYEIVWHRRKTPLVCMDHTVDYTRVQPGMPSSPFFQGGGPQRGGGPAPGGGRRPPSSTAPCPTPPGGGRWRASWPGRCGMWWPPMPSAWGSTSPSAG